MSRTIIRVIGLVLFSVMLLSISGNTAATKQLIMVGTPQGDRIFEAIIPQFQKANPGVKVQYTSLPREQFDAWFKARVNAGSNIDIVMLDPQFFLDYWQNGFLADITSAFSNRTYKNLKKDRFVDGALDFKVMGGKIYNVPMNIILTLFYYNKDIFNKYDIAVPKTYDDLLTVKKKLDGTKILPMAYAGKELWWNPMMYYALLPMYTNNNCQEFTKATIRGERKWTDPVYVKAFERLKWLWDNNILTQESFGLDYNGLTAMLIQGGVATVYQGSWFYAEGVKPAMTKDFNLGVFPIPSITGAGHGQPCGCTDVALSVYAKSKNKTLALKFVDFAMSESVGKFMAEQGYMSALKGIDPVDPVLQDVMRMYDGVAVEHLVDHLWEPQITQEVQYAVQALLLGQITPIKAAERVQAAQDQLIKEGKSYASIFKK